MRTLRHRSRPRAEGGHQRHEQAAQPCNQFYHTVCLPLFLEYLARFHASISFGSPFVHSRRAAVKGEGAVICDKTKELREKAGHSQAQLAKRLDVTRSSMNA